MTNWIKCSDRFPYKDGRYLVTEHYPPVTKWVGVCSLRNGKWDSYRVVAWQELPEPAEMDDE